MNVSLGERILATLSDLSRLSDTVKIYEIYWFFIKLALFWFDPTELRDSATSCMDMFSDLTLESLPLEFFEFDGISSRDFKLL